MRKTLVALAASAVAAAASAQSSVTLFGVVDVAISRYSATSAWYNNTTDPSLSAPPTGVQKIRTSQTVMSQGNLATSRLGFRGTEDLGGGLAAGFWLEGQVNPDDGRGLSAFNRRSTISLIGSLGELRLGRDYTASFWNDTIFDPLGGVGVGISLINSVYTNLATVRGAPSPTNPGVIGMGGSDNYVRTANSIGYLLPPTLGGIYGQVQYALPENVRTDGVPGSPSNKGRYMGARVGYAKGPLDIAAGYGDSTAADFTGVAATGAAMGVITKDTIKSANIGASYDFGLVKLFAEFSMAHDERESTAPNAGGVAVTVAGTDKYTGGLVGATVPIGAGLIRMSYSRVDYKNGQTSTVPVAVSADRDASADKIAISYVYNLSKRTALYATAARIRIKDGQIVPAVIGATVGGPTYVSTGNGVAGYAPTNATGFDLGIRHSF